MVRKMRKKQKYAETKQHVTEKPIGQWKITLSLNKNSEMSQDKWK